MTYGMTVCDRRPPESGFSAKYESLHPFNSTMVAAMDEAGFKAYLKELIVEKEDAR
ncbi:hypothetical protein SDC9_212364 [bioreactor metagenome]|uniref:Uncharacterized protein n=1 Tax=bioreactor metagenome TaxID=1076179 RepID=A0A645JLP6_9ZZZZ